MSNSNLQILLLDSPPRHSQGFGKYPLLFSCCATALKILEKRSRTLSVEIFFYSTVLKGTKFSGDSVHERNSRILRAVHLGWSKV